MTISTVFKITIGTIITSISFAGIASFFHVVWKHKHTVDDLNKQFNKLDKRIDNNTWEKMNKVVGDYESNFGEIHIPTPEEIKSLQDEIASDELAIQVGKKYGLDFSQIEAELINKKFNLSQMEKLATKIANVMRGNFDK